MPQLSDRDLVRKLKEVGLMAPNPAALDAGLSDLVALSMEGLEGQVYAILGDLDPFALRLVCLGAIDALAREVLARQER